MPECLNALIWKGRKIKIPVLRINVPARPRVRYMELFNPNKSRWFISSLTHVHVDKAEAVDLRGAISSWLKWRPHLGRSHSWGSPTLYGGADVHTCPYITSKCFIIDGY